MLSGLLPTLHQPWFIPLFFGVFAGIFLLAAAYEVRNVSRSRAAGVCLVLGLLCALVAIAFHVLQR